jgi:hypothetical protein
MKTKKLIKAIKFIKRYCAEKDDCDGCPFYNLDKTDCYLLSVGMIYPAQWDVKAIKNNLKDVEEL